MENLLVLIIPVTILWPWLGQVAITNRTIDGDIIRIMPIPLLARIKRYTIPALVTYLLTFALVLLGYASAWWIALATISIMGLVLPRKRYTVTTRGIRVSYGPFRRWTEFAGVHRSPAGATLQTIRRGPGMPVWLSGSRDDDEFVHLLRTLVRDAYKGKTTIIPAPATSEPPQPDGTDISHIAAFTRGH